MTSWNTHSPTRERFQYFSNLGLDVLDLTERPNCIWRRSPTYTDGTVSWTYGEVRINTETGQPVYPRDESVGVGILLTLTTHTIEISES